MNKTEKSMTAFDMYYTELREEVGVKERFRRKLVRSQLKWAGHMERMEGERLKRERMPLEWSLAPDFRNKEERNNNVCIEF